MVGVSHHPTHVVFKAYHTPLIRSMKERLKTGEVCVMSAKIIVIFVAVLCFSVPVLGFAEEESGYVLGSREARKEHGQWAHQIKIVNDESSPVQINEVNLSIRYEKPSRLRRLGRDLNRLGSSVNLMPYNYEVNIKSKGDAVVGVVYSVLYYDSFNKYIDGSNLVSLPFQTNKIGRWGWHRKPPPGFRLYGMGCVFVRTARLKDGSIWNFDVKAVVRLLKKNECGKYGTKEIREHIKNNNKDNPIVVF